MKVSVITINLNNLEGLKRTFESVVAQDFPGIEYLVIDGESSDGSRRYIEDNLEKVSFFLSEKDSGVYDAMNKGIKQASGNYLIFLNSGDFFTEPDSISKLLANSQGEDLVYGNILVQETEKSWVKTYPAKLNFRYFYFESIPHPACLIARRLFDQLGHYDTSLKIASDWKFFLLVVVKHHCSYCYVDQVISTFYLDGVSSNSENLAKLESERRFTLKQHFNLYFVLYSCYLKVLKKGIYHEL